MTAEPPPTIGKLIWQSITDSIFGGGGFSWQRTKAANQCAAANANKHSVATLLHVQNVAFIGTMFSNNVSSASQVVFGPNRSGGIPSLAMTGASSALKPAANAAGSTTVSSGFQFLFSSTSATTLGQTTVGSFAVSGTLVLAKALGFVGAAQFLYDAGTYVTALVPCSIDN